MIQLGHLCGAAKALKAQGAKKVYAYITHPVLSGKAYENIKKSMLDEIVVTDTIPLHEKAKSIKQYKTNLSIWDVSRNNKKDS